MHELVSAKKAGGSECQKEDQTKSDEEVITLAFGNLQLLIWPDLDRVLLVRPPCITIWLSVEEALEAVERARSNGS